MIVKKIKNRYKSASKSVRIRELAEYILSPDAEDGTAKCIYWRARGFVTSDLNAQIAEMIALAHDAVRSPDPIDHLVLSWPEGEHPSEEQIEEVIDLLLDELKVLTHLALYALHVDTENWHLHVILNRVHPEELNVVKIDGGFGFKALHRACARMEHAQGWKPQKNALYRVNEKGEVVPTSSERQERGGKPTSSQIDNELRKGEKSAARLAIEIAGPILADARSWVEAHEQLSQHDMRYLKAGSGAVIQVGEVRVKASTVSREATLPELEKRLEPYVSPHAHGADKECGGLTKGRVEKTGPPSVPNPKAAWPFIKAARIWEELHHTLAEHDMRYEKTGSGATIFAGMNDEVSMKASAVHRKAALRQLEDRFGPYLPPSEHELAQPDSATIHADFPRWLEYAEAMTGDVEKERLARETLNKELLEQAEKVERKRTKQQKERAALFRQRSWEGQIAALHLQRSLLAAEHAKEKEELKEIFRLRRQKLVDTLPAPREYGDWIDDAELALLWNRRRSRPACIEPSERTTLLTARRRKHDIRDYHGRPVDDWVIYATNEQRARGEIAFVDRNERIDIHDSNSEASILAALQLSAEKWGRFGVRGDGAYKETCARLAAEHGFRIKNPELQQSILEYRKELSKRQAKERRKERVGLTPKSVPPGSPAPTPRVPDSSKGRRGGYDR